MATHSGESPNGSPQQASFADRLALLVAAIRPIGERSYSDAEIVRTLAARGTEVSAPYFSQLRSGQRSRPSPAVISALADFFGVLPSYFTGGNPCYTGQLQRELIWMVIAADPGVRRVTSAILELSPQQQDVILAALEEHGVGTDSVSASLIPTSAGRPSKRRRVIPLMQLAITTGIGHDRLTSLLGRGDDGTDWQDRRSVSVTELRRQVQRLDRELRRLRCVVERAEPVF